MNLEAQGWERRFMGGPPRIEEVVTLYQGLGYEVKLAQPTEQDLRPQCGHCRMALDLFRVVYTRKNA